MRREIEAEDSDFRQQLEKYGDLVDEARYNANATWIRMAVLDS